MPKQAQVPSKITNIIKSFKNTLENTPKRKFQYTSQLNYYQTAKKAQTQQRDLEKALVLYIKAIQHNDKKDSSIKDFASSLHQLGFTKQAVKLMDESCYYYDGNMDKYWNLRDNLEIQIKDKRDDRNIAKHECKFLLVQNFLVVYGDQKDVIMNQNQEELKKSLFKQPKRIKRIKFFEDLDLSKQSVSGQLGQHILVEFESFSAAKKTLQSFNFEQLFGLSLYWINSNTMSIVCSATNGKSDFQQGLIVTQSLINKTIQSQKLNRQFWFTFGIQKYKDVDSNGFLNLLAIHLINQFGTKTQTYDKSFQEYKNKQNIFESSKIHYRSTYDDKQSDYSISNVIKKGTRQSHETQYREGKNYKDYTPDKNSQNQDYSNYSHNNFTKKSRSFSNNYQVNGIYHKRNSHEYLRNLEY